MTDPDFASYRDFVWLRDRVETKASSVRVEKLDEKKADVDDVNRLAEEFKSLRRTLQWFMGLVTVAVVAVAGMVFAVLERGAG
jgi:hypothetical protein